MNFIEKILTFLRDSFNNVIDALFEFIKFLAKPLAYLLEFLEGIFYFFVKIFEVVIQIIMIFVACFQFVGALFMGVFRTITSWLTVSPSSDLSFPSVSNTGFQAVVNIVQPTGLMTVVPMVAIAFIWFFFVIKMIGLFGGQIMIMPQGRSSGD